MNQKNPFHFSVLNFCPQLIIFLWFVPSICLTGVINLLSGREVAVTIGLGSLLITFIVFCIWIARQAHGFYLSADHPFIRIITLILAHSLMVFPVFFLLAAALGGASMAAVDAGATGALVRYGQYILAANIGTFFTQILIIPWSILCVLALQKIAK